LIKRTFTVLLGGACFGLAIALASMLVPLDAEPPITAWLKHDMAIEAHYAAFKASIAAIDVFDVAETVPAGDAFCVAAVAGDGLTMTDRLNQVQQGGRVKSATSLLVSPASRWSARV